MLRKRICALFAGLALIAPAVSADESAETENLLADYARLEWQGDTLYLDQPSAAVYFMSSGKEEQRAILPLNIEEEPTGFYFRIDGGNGLGHDSGYCTLTFFDGEHNALYSVSTGLIENFDNYSRFSIGNEVNYFPVPKGAETVEIALNARQTGDSGRVNMYFRNLALFFDNERPLLPQENLLYMESTAGLTKVEIGVTEFTRYLWIGVVFLVAISFYLIRRWQDKYKTARVIKGTDIKRKRGR